MLNCVAWDTPGTKITMAPNKNRKLFVTVDSEPITSPEPDIPFIILERTFLFAMIGDQGPSFITTQIENRQHIKIQSVSKWIGELFQTWTIFDPRNSLILVNTTQASLK